MSYESIKPPASSNNSLATALSYCGTKSRLKCDGGCLKEDKITFTYAKTINIYEVYEVDLWDPINDEYTTLEKFFVSCS